MYFGTSPSRLPQPASSKAGPVRAARRPPPPLPLPPSTEDEELSVPLAEVSQTSPGATRERSRMLLSHAKRPAATCCTVVRRAIVCSVKSAYGLSAAACCSELTSSELISASCCLPEFTWLVTTTM